MFPFGGAHVMLVGAAISFVLCAGLAIVLRRRVATSTAVFTAGLVWWVTVIAFVTLIPANGAPGIVSSRGRLTYCSTDYGGPAPDGFWIFASGQRLLNLALFVPAGFSIVLAASRRRLLFLVVVPVGLVVLSAYSLGIELVQLHLARLDRNCDITDIVDNTTGAAIGLAVGSLVVLVLRPWRRRAAVRAAAGRPRSHRADTRPRARLR